MAAESHFYGLYLKRQAEGSAPVVWGTDTIKALLTTSAYTPNRDTHQFRNSVTNEIAGTGYTAGGVAIASRSISYDATTHQVRYIGEDVSWTAATFTARRLVIYKSTGVEANDVLIGWVDFGADQSPAGTNFVVDFDQVLGDFKITAE